MEELNWVYQKLWATGSIYVPLKQCYKKEIKEVLGVIVCVWAEDSADAMPGFPKAPKKQPAWTRFLQKEQIQDAQIPPKDFF